MTSEQQATQLNGAPVDTDRELTIEEIKKAIPAFLLKKEEMRFLINVGFSVSLTLLTGFLAYKFIPFTALPVRLIFLFSQ